MTKKAKTVSGQLIQLGIPDWDIIKFEQRQRRFSQWNRKIIKRLEKMMAVDYIHDLDLVDLREAEAQGII